jgi:hypothetical protein
MTSAGTKRAQQPTHRPLVSSQWIRVPGLSVHQVGEHRTTPLLA